MRDIHCKRCRRLLGKGIDLRGQLEVKCKCGYLNRFDFQAIQRPMKEELAEVLTP